MRETGFKTPHFDRWARETQLADDVLCDAVAEIELGLIYADLGGGLVKKRVALPGRGRSGSTRVLLATNRTDRWLFVFGFEKAQLGKISDQRERAQGVTDACD